MFPHKITIFRYVLDKNSRMDVLQTPVVYDGVLWEDSKAANVIKSGLENADRAVIYVPFTTCGNVSDPFLKGDYAVKGEVTYSGTQAELTKSFPDAVRITSVDKYDFGGLQHYKLSGS